MCRWLLRTFSVVCLLLVIATIVLWVRSYWSDDRVMYVASPGYYVDFSADTEPGAMRAFLNMCLAPHTVEPGWRFGARSYRGMSPSLLPKQYPLLSDDLVWHSYRLGSERITHELACPFWALVGVFGVASVPPLLPWVRCYRRRRHGLCETCGYDLRASPERCPECGTPVRRLPTSTAGEAPAATPEADGRRQTPAPPPL
jgi:hypothetical protein